VIGALMARSATVTVVAPTAKNMQGVNQQNFDDLITLAFAIA
jgi:hypothetical protein